jgi:thiamine-monophosphate kinase
MATVQEDRMGLEDQLIKQIAGAIPSECGGRGPRDLILGIGDDAAILRSRGKKEWVVSSDAFVEGTHFLSSKHPPKSIGYKSLTRAASDISAMGAAPELFLLTIALPRTRIGKWLDQLLRGMGQAARELGITLAGGDTTTSSRVLISITVFGQVRPGHALTRSRARPEDIIYVSGRLGRAQLGWELVKRGLGLERRFADLARPHLYPKIRVSLGRWLAERGAASAMIDISDGLSTDLARLATASRVGARLSTEAIPRVEVPAFAPGALGGLELDPLEMALHGGDDYELLFTVPPKHVKWLRAAPGFRELTAIGEITRKRRILLEDAAGGIKSLDSRGWDPFRTRRHAHSPRAIPSQA